MKKLLLSLFSAWACISLSAQGSMQATISAQLPSQAQLAIDYAQGKTDKAPSMAYMGSVPLAAPEFDWTDTDTVAYFVAAQSYLKGTAFNYSDGDFCTYDMGVVRDGNKVTITNLFNQYDPNNWAVSHEIPLQGVYDPEQGTITIETPVVAVNHWSIYEASLYAGAVDQDGNFTPEGDLVFDVDEDFTTISSTTAFGVRYSFGWIQIYKDFTAVVKDPNSAADIRVLSNELDFGQAYSQISVEHLLTLANMGATGSSCQVEITQGASAFQVLEADDYISAYGTGSVLVNFSPDGVGTYYGELTITDDAGKSSKVQLVGEGIDLFDYSPIVLNGDFKFETGLDFPFLITEVEHPIYDADGNATGQTETITVARSSTDGQYGQSYIKAKFNVPDGMVGKLSFKGSYINKDNIYYVINSYILIDDDDYYSARYVLSGDFKEEDCTYLLPEGEHFLKVVNFDNLSRQKESCTYIWDLNLDIVEPDDSGIAIITPEVFMGYGIIDWVGIYEAQSSVQIRNTGLEEMEVLSISSDNPEFSAKVPSKGISLLEYCDIPVTLTCTEAGEKNATLTIETNVGTVEAKISALVIDEPDYSELVTEGAEYITAFYIDPKYPFMMKDGVATNVTSKWIHPDDEVVSVMGFFIDIPEGEEADIFFTGHNWGTPEANYVPDPYWNYGFFSIEMENGSCNLWSGFWDNDIDFSEEYFKSNDMGQFMHIPYGVTYIEFGYVQQGARSYYGEDKLELYSFGVRLASGVQDSSIKDVVREEIYNLQGMRCDEYQQGINIVRYIHADGSISTKKVLRK